jgi:tetratricopeptide (TPR) repeat protein
MLEKQIYSSKVFSTFKTINHRDAKAVVRFYHQNKANIDELSFYEAFVLQLHYASALHDLGEYEKHLDEADKIIYLSIDNNIQYYKGEDIYQKTLFEKAQSYYFLEDFEKAMHIYLELIKIDSENVRYVKELKEVLLKTEVIYLDKIVVFGTFVSLFNTGFLTLYLLVANYILAYQEILVKIFTYVFTVGFLFSILGLVLQEVILGKKIIEVQERASKLKN